MGCIISLETLLASSVKYEKLKNKLETGDIVLFSGTGFESFEIQLATFSPYSHVGVIIKCKDIKGKWKARDDLYIWHSPAQTLPFAYDSITNQMKEGPQLNKLQAVLSRASGNVYIRKLEKISSTVDEETPPLLSLNVNNNNDDIEDIIKDPCKTKLMKWMKEEEPKAYETSTVELVKSAWDGPCGKNKRNTTSYFCSELIAETYQQMGLLEKKEPSNEFVPADFSKDMQLNGGYFLSPNITRVKV